MSDHCKIQFIEINYKSISGFTNMLKATSEYRLFAYRYDNCNLNVTNRLSIAHFVLKELEK